MNMKTFWTLFDHLFFLMNFRKLSAKIFKKSKEIQMNKICISEHPYLLRKIGLRIFVQLLLLLCFHRMKLNLYKKNIEKPIYF